MSQCNWSHEDECSSCGWGPHGTPSSTRWEFRDSAVMNNGHSNLYGLDMLTSCHMKNASVLQLEGGSQNNTNICIQQIIHGYISWQKWMGKWVCTEQKWRDCLVNRWVQNKWRVLLLEWMDMAQGGSWASAFDKTPQYCRHTSRAVWNTDRGHDNWNICILSDRQQLKLLTITTAIPHDTKHAGMQLVHALAYRGNDGSKMDTQSVTAGSGHPPSCAILDRVPKRAMRKWRNGQHYQCWKSIPGHKHGKDFIPSALQVMMHWTTTANKNLIYILDTYRACWAKQ
jgi:hypothetical protein